MRFALTQKVLTFALAATAAFPVLSSGEVGVPFVGLFAALFVAGWFIGPPFTETPLFRRYLTGAVVVLFGLQIARLAAGAPMAMLGMEFIAALLGIKLISRAYAADDNQIIILSFLHIIAATVVMTEIVYGVAFLVFVTLSSPMLALSYLRQEIENRFAPKSGREKNREMISRLFNSKRIVSLRFLLGSALLTVPILFITGLLFIAFPRIGLGFMGSRASHQVAVGFGSEVVLGDMDIVRMEDTVVVRITPMSPSPAPEAWLGIKIRGAVFEHFDGERWQKASDLGWWPLPSDGRVYRLTPRAPAPHHPRFDVLLETMTPKLVFVPEGTGRIEVEPLSNRHELTPEALEANHYGEIRYRDSASIGLRYQVTIDGSPPIGAPPMTPSSYLSLYSGGERLRALAERTAGEGPASEKAERLVRMLKERYRYALRLSKDSRNLEESTPLDRFLFSRRSGTCEHFSTALTLMLRAVGVPARLVTGFSGADWNDIGAFYSVRKRYAHSWTEAFINGAWRTLDATPPVGTSDEGLRPNIIARLTDALKMKWQQHIVGYNVKTQSRLALRLWRFARSPRSGAAGIPSAALGQALGAVGLVIAALGLFLFLRWRRRRARKYPSPQQRRIQREATSLLDAIEHRLGRLGFHRPPAVPPIEYLEQISSEAQFSLSDAISLVERYNAVRFGCAVFEPKELRHLFSRARAIGSVSPGPLNEAKK